MKLTKKILSLVLAAALVLGSIAVAANAADYDGLTYEGSELAYKIEADKTEVKPGETVTFSVYMKNNYYIGASGGEFFLWTKGAFETITESDIVFEGIVAKTYNVTPNYEPASGMYPSSHKYAEWDGYLSSRNANAGTVPEIISDFELIYTITLKVKEDAVPGSEITFEMPEGSLKSAAQTGRKGTIYQAMAKSVDNAATSIAYSESVDLSVASVTITVASAVEYCDYAALSAAVAKAPELAEEYYDAEEYKAWTDAKAAGQALLDAEALEKTDENQKTIDDAAQLIEDTLAALDARYVDLSVLAEYVRVLGETNYSEEYYDAELYTAWKDALAAAEKALVDYEGAPETKQGEVNIIGEELHEAYNALVPAFADLTKLNDAVENCDEPAYAAEYYDADLYAAWEQALADAKAAQQTYASAPATQQGKVDEAEAALRTAFAALDPSVLDISALTTAIDECDEAEYAAEYYDAVEYAAWEKALADAKAGVTTYTGAADTAANREAVAALAQALRDAFAALDARFVDASAIANAITAYGAAEYAAEYYDVNEYAAWEAALAAANDADFTGKADTEENRAAVAKIADDLKVAYEALDARILDTTPITEAIAACVPEYTEEYYDAGVWANFQVIIESAAIIAEDYKAAADTAENRELVQYYVDEINSWYEKLVPQFVSYEKLEKAVVDYAKPEHPEFYYTPDSWNAYQDALAAANDANTNRPQPLPAATQENQAAVDAYADALEKAYNELTAAECHIISVTPLQEIYDLNDVINLSVLVEGKATKVQLIRGTNATSTYTRTHTSVKSITENGDGTETWVIARRVYEKDYTEYAKAKFGKVWDTGVYAYDLVCKGDDLSVKSIEVTLDGEVVDTVTRADLPTLTIVTGPAVKKLRLVDPATGGAISFSSPVSVNEDGTKVWVIVKQYNQVKMYDLDVSVKGSAGWVDSGVDFELNVVKNIESQLPSTDNVEDAILSASVAKTRILRGATQTFTITTDKAAKAVRILKADGSVFKTISAPASVEGDVATWTYECSYSSIGERSYTAEALYGNTWIADADSAVSFTVIY